MRLHASDVFYELISYYAEAVAQGQLNTKKIQSFVNSVNDLSEQFCLDIVQQPQT